MSRSRAYIAGTGVICPLGTDVESFRQRLLEGRSAIAPLTLFALQQGNPLPVGEVRDFVHDPDLPRTHGLALDAAQQAMAGEHVPPDALVLGTTTGGILTTEELLRRQDRDKKQYRYHGLDTVARFVARRLEIQGPVLTVSTACSSGAVALTMALELLRSGRARRVLAGGVDSLCRLTYFGFHSLQLVDKESCRPMDINRQGMAVAEGAAMLLLTAEQPDNPLAELLGAGLSCDAHHSAAPHPEGRGAAAAMQAALADSALSPSDIDYINLHGTGTVENDLAESLAVRRLFSVPPPISSVKGATGHSLAAAGAIEAVLATLATGADFMPANTGFAEQDPAIGLVPLTEPVRSSVRAVLSNSFGFGGNNGSLVIGKPDIFPARPARSVRTGLSVYGCSCLSGTGRLQETMERLMAGRPVAGTAADSIFGKKLPLRSIRRLKRLSRMALFLAAETLDGGGKPPVSSIFMGTGWGALSETHDFLTRLFETGEQFPSPTDFVGSVHNGPASQAAIMFGATGANVTTSGGDFSFEQALLSAELMLSSKGRALLMGADEAHPQLTPLLDPSVDEDTPPADGGGCLFVGRGQQDALCTVNLLYYGAADTGGAMEFLLHSLGGRNELRKRCALVLAGLPGAVRPKAEQQLQEFLARSGLRVPVVRYRELTGEFAAASAVAATLAVNLSANGEIPSGLSGNVSLPLAPHHTILVLGLGDMLSIMEFSRP